MRRPDWDSYYMVRAFWACRRSPDPSTKHGCIFVGPNHEPISEGYNGYPRGSRDDLMPKTRPEKYLVTLHSEENAIFHAEPKRLEGATAYITGEPCTNCWARMLQVGIKRFVIGSKGSAMVDEKILAVTRILLAGRDIEIIHWTPEPRDIAWHVCELLKDLGLTDQAIGMLREMEPAAFGDVCQGER